MMARRNVKEREKNRHEERRWSFRSSFISTPSDRTRHRMAQRKLSRRDISHCLKYGRVVEHSKPSRLWRYKVRGSTVDGEPMSCVVEINGKLVLITVIR